MRGASAQRWRFIAGSYFSFLFFPLFTFAVTYRGISWLVPALLVTVAVPILDSLTGEDRTIDGLQLLALQRWLAESAPALFVLGNAAVVGVTAHIFSGLTLTEKFLSVISVGMIGSVGITAAHELVHKHETLSKVFGRIGLANVLYLHFEINHIRGHHVRVGTDQDQSTAWLGESLYRFFARTVPGCLKLSWELERDRLTRRGLGVIGAKNQMFQFAFLQCAYVAGILNLGGKVGVAFFVLQAFIAVFMLEAVAYIEHYGLLRAKRTDGKYSPMSPAHSWDCYGRFSNYLMFQLQRHADHHSFPTKDFSSLQTVGEAPKLPVGYPLLIGIAMVPPWWRRLMNPRVQVVRAESYREGSVSA